MTPISHFFEENALLHHFDYGFRKFHSTETTLTRPVDQLFLDSDKNRATGVVFIDYEKAFDRRDRGLLLTKLNVSGMCGHEIDLLHNYLSGRKQYLVIDGCHFFPRTVTAGAPQWSILVPIIFLLIINDLPLAAQRSTVRR